MKNVTNILEDVSIVFGVTIGVTQIESILGIIILVFQIVLILYKGTRKIIEKIKKKDLDGIEEDLKETTDELEKLSNKDKDGK